MNLLKNYVLLSARRYAVTPHTITQISKNIHKTQVVVILVACKDPVRFLYLSVIVNTCW